MKHVWLLALLPLHFLRAAAPEACETVQSIAEKQLALFKDVLIAGGAGAVGVGAELRWMHLQNRHLCGLPFSNSPHFWYRGYILNTVARFPTMSIQFVAYDAFTRYLLNLTRHEGKPLSDQDRIIAASTAGALSASVATPNEMLFMYRHNQELQKTMLEKTTSFYTIVKHLVNHHGIQSLWRGLGPAVIRNSIITTAWVPEWGGHISNAFDLHDSDYEWTANIAGGATAALCAALLTTPPNTAKVLMQGDIDGKIYPTMFSVFKSLYNEGGFKTLIGRGLGFRTGQVVSGVVFVRLYFEALKELGIYAEEGKE